MGLGKKLKKIVKKALNPKVVTQSLIDGGRNSLKQLSKGDFKGAVNTAGIGFFKGGADPLSYALADSYERSINKPLPNVNINNDIRDQQKQLINNQLYNAENFDVGKYVTQEANAYRRKLSNEVAGAQNNLRGNENARGMLFSGRRQKGEGDIGRAAQTDYQSYGNDLIQDAMKRQQAMATDPLAATANLQSANQRQSSSLQSIRDQQNAANTQRTQQGMGMIGQGIGQGTSNYQNTGSVRGR